jgi:transposase
VQPVPVKTIDQQALQALHRVRTQWQATRTGRINVMRGLLREQGCPVPAGARTVVRRVAAIVDEPARALPAVLRQTVRHLLEEVRDLEARVAAIDRELAQVARAHPVATRLQQIPGVGIVTATAMIGAVGHIHAFRRGRDFASWLGLTPRESTTGTRRYLGRISKHGDGYLRCLLTHGARAVLLAAQSWRGSSGPCGATRLIFIRHVYWPRRRKRRLLTRRDAQRGLMIMA